jgi:hypothetical protein
MTFKEFLEDKKIPFYEEGEDIWVEDSELIPHLDEIKVLFPELSIEVETVFQGTEEEFKLFLKNSGLELTEEDLDWLETSIENLDDLEDIEDWTEEDWIDYWEKEESEEPKESEESEESNNTKDNE